MTQAIIFRIFKTMNKFQKMMEDFLKDRNGADELALFLSVVGLIAIVGAGAF